ncbi:MAG: hypothetical protein R2771_09920 [Saprospiraceae bacterium]
MSIYKLSLFIVFTFFYFSSQSQSLEKEDITLEDAVFRAYSDFYPDYYSGLQWNGESPNILRLSDDGNSVLMMDDKYHDWESIVSTR